MGETTPGKRDVPRVVVTRRHREIVLRSRVPSKPPHYPIHTYEREEKLQEIAVADVEVGTTSIAMATEDDVDVGTASITVAIEDRVGVGRTVGRRIGGRRCRRIGRVNPGGEPCYG